LPTPQTIAYDRESAVYEKSFEAVAESDRSIPPRIVFIENVRWAMILLVLSMHAAVTYSPVGDWYYREHPLLGPISTLFFVTYQGVLQGFFMALLFFVAGYFVPMTYDTKGTAQFLRARIYRLGLPTLFYVVILGPITEYYVAHSWRSPHSFAHEMWLYLVRGRFLSGTGPLWFCAALLMFCVAYIGLRLIRPKTISPAKIEQIKPAGVAFAVVAIALSTFAVRLVMPLGSSILNMQLCYFPSYIIMFGLGAMARRSSWLEAIDDRFAWKSATACLSIAAVAWLPLLILGGGLSGRTEPYSGGVHWQSAGLSLWEALICVGMSFAVLVTFRGRFSRQSRMAKFHVGERVCGLRHSSANSDCHRPGLSWHRPSSRTEICAPVVAERSRLFWDCRATRSPDPPTRGDPKMRRATAKATRPSAPDRTRTIAQPALAFVSRWISCQADRLCHGDPTSRRRGRARSFRALHLPRFATGKHYVVVSGFPVSRRLLSDDIMRGQPSIEPV